MLILKLWEVVGRYDRDVRNITGIYIPSSVSEFSGFLGEYPSVTKIVIADGVTDLKINGVFCNLKNIKVLEGNSKYDSRDNCNAVIETDTNTLVVGSGSTIIPNSVTNIANNAFSNNNCLTNITIPNSITSVGIGVFYKCSNLTSIKVLEGNSKYDSRDNCNAIIETDTNTLIVGCGNTIIPNSVINIANNAFWGCSGLKNITIPNSIKVIAENVFGSCTSLENIIIPESVTSIGESAFYNCTSLKELTIPESVTSIGEVAFYDCTSLKSITVPSRVTNISESVFLKCSNLTSIKVSEENSKYDSRDNCNAIIEKDTNTLVVGGCETIIPNSVTTIGANAFFGRKSLKSITIPDSVTKIGENAFEDCEGLENITISSNTKYIEFAAFAGCNNLKTINYTGPEEEWNKISIKNGNKELTIATKNYNYTE